MRALREAARFPELIEALTGTFIWRQPIFSFNSSSAGLQSASVLELFRLMLLTPEDIGDIPAVIDALRSVRLQY